MVATTSTTVAIRYTCDRIQLGSDSGSCPNDRGASLTESTFGLAASQSRHTLRPSDMGNPQPSQFRTFPNLPGLIGLGAASAFGSTSAVFASAILVSTFLVSEIFASMTVV